MCLLCGTLGGAHWAEADGAAARAVRLRLVRRVLEPFGLTLENWGGSRYPVRGADGELAVPGSLGALWLEAARLHGAPLDPLAPALLDALER